MAFTIVPVVLSIYQLTVAPRPYYLMATDLEADYYYNAALVLEGERPSGGAHPGTPLNLAAGLALRLFASNFEGLVDSTQQVLHVFRAVGAILVSVSLWVFVSYMRPRMSDGALVLSLAAVLGWPSLLTYTDYFGSELYMFTLGLPVMTLFWSTLEDSEVRTGRAVLCGIGIGVGMATKMSFLVVGGTCCLGYALHAILTSRRGESIRALAAKVLVMPLTAAAIFVILIVPVLYRVPELMQGPLLRNARPTAWTASTVRILLVSAPVWSAAALLTTMVFGAVIFKVWMNRERRKTPSGDPFDFTSASISLACLLGYFFWSVGTSKTAGYPEAGIAVRNLSLGVLALPFAVAFCERMSAGLNGDFPLRAPRFDRLWLLVAVAVVGSSSFIYLERRAEWVSRGLADAATASRETATHTNGAGRTAFWDGSPGRGVFGPASFHFWGNATYASCYFDESLLRHFPDYTHLRLRAIRDNAPPDRPARGVKGFLKRLKSTWEATFPPPPYTTGRPQLVAGERSGVKLSGLFVLDEPETHDIGLSSIERLASGRFGLQEAGTVTIGADRFYAYRPPQ